MPHNICRVCCGVLLHPLDCRTLAHKATVLGSDKNMQPHVALAVGTAL